MREGSASKMDVSLFWIISSLLIPLISTEDGSSTERNVLNWYETLPAVAMDYKVHIDAGKLAKQVEVFMFSIIFVDLCLPCHLTTRQGGLLPSIRRSRRNLLRVDAGKASTFH